MVDDKYGQVKVKFGDEEIRLESDTITRTTGVARDVAQAIKAAYEEDLQVVTSVEDARRRVTAACVWVCCPLGNGGMLVLASFR